MPFSGPEITAAGYAVLDYYEKNSPIDQNLQEYPLYDALAKTKREFPGAKEYIVEQLRTSYGSNLQFFNGDDTVTYNTRQSLNQAKYPWRSCHDGLSLTEDQLAQHGITLHDGEPKQATRAEVIQLTNLLNEQMEILQEGNKEKMNQYLWLDGTGGGDDLAGIMHLVSLTPTSGTVGGIDRSTSTWWRNNVATSLSGNIVKKMEEMWRDCVRYGRGRPTHIFAGWSFIEAYRTEVSTVATGLTRIVNASGKNAVGLDGSTDLYFRGVPIVHIPQFDDNFGGAYTTATHCTKRCYMLTLGSNIRLRPMAGQDGINRKPPRPHDKYVHYWARTWRGGLTMNNARQHAVLALS